MCCIPGSCSPFQVRQSSYLYISRGSRLSLFQIQQRLLFRAHVTSVGPLELRRLVLDGQIAAGCGLVCQRRAWSAFPVLLTRSNSTETRVVYGKGRLEKGDEHLSRMKSLICSSLACSMADSLSWRPCPKNFSWTKSTPIHYNVLISISVFL